MSTPTHPLDAPAPLLSEHSVTSLDVVHHADALSLLRGLPGGFADVVITDPPYAAGRLVSSRRSPADRFNEIPGNVTVQRAWMLEAYRALRTDGAIYVFATWRNSETWQGALTAAGFNVKNCIVWDKVVHGLGDLEGGYAFQHEFIIFAVKGRHLLRGSRPKDVIRIPRVPAEQLRHPYQKPTALLERLIMASSDVGDVVIDPFAGSGATGKAAQNTARRYVLCDIKREYVCDARAWLAEAYTLPLFAAQEVA